MSPISRVYRVYQANPANPGFPLAANAVAIDGQSSYYTWNELSRNIPQAVTAGLPPGFDYSPWVPDGQLASGGRVNPALFPRTYAGLDQVSPDWPTVPVNAGQTITVDFYATAPHSPSVWDVWMTTPDWRPTMPLTWARMQWLGRPQPTLASSHFTFPLTIPADRAGDHVLWIAWQRNDPAGEVFFSTSDVLVRPVNDDCAGAVAIGSGPTTVTTRGATASTAGPSCQPAGLADVWFLWQAPATGTMRAATCGSGAAIDTVVSIWSGSCGALTASGCDDDGCGVRSAATAPVTAAQTYRIRVATRGTAADFVLDVGLLGGPIAMVQPSLCAGNPPLTLAVSGVAALGGTVHVAFAGSAGGVPVQVFGHLPATQPLLPTCACHVVTAASVWFVGSSLAIQVPLNPGLVGLQLAAQGIDVAGAAPTCAVPLPTRLTDVWAFTLQ